MRTTSVFGGLSVALAMLAGLSCRTRQSFAVIAGTPTYFVRLPDGSKMPFPGLLSRSGNFVPGQGWIDLRPEMELRVENAYYRAGSPKRGMEGYLGTEIAVYQFRSSGDLHLLSVQSMRDRPTDQPPVQELITAAQRHHREYRLFFEITFRTKVETRGSVLIGGESEQELERMSAALLGDPAAFCAANRDNCTVFPVACSVSVELPVYVNGRRSLVPWSSTLKSILPADSQATLRRLHDGRLRPVRINTADVNAVAIPLLPGDHIQTR